MPVTAAAPPPAAPAFVQLRSPQEQARLGALAQVLGRVHALHRLCAGPADAQWRAPMQHLLEVEHATPALRERLTRSFNAGFAGVHDERCGPVARSELAAAAAEGRDLARGLASAPDGSAVP